MASPELRPVFIVEDDSGMSNAIVRILRLAGFAPRAFVSAEALLASGCAADAGCMILDVNLPGLTGFQLQQRLALLGNRSPVIFITAYDEPESREQAVSAGAIAYLIKPFSGNMLVEKVAGAMGQAAAR